MTCGPFSIQEPLKERIKSESLCIIYRLVFHLMTFTYKSHNKRWYLINYTSQDRGMMIVEARWMSNITSFLEVEKRIIPPNASDSNVGCILLWVEPKKKKKIKFEPLKWSSNPIKT